MTLMVLLSCLVALIFLAVVAWALIQINEQLAAIGGTPWRVFWPNSDWA